MSANTVPLFSVNLCAHRSGASHPWFTSSVGRKQE